MKLKILDQKAQEKGTLKLPSQFAEAVRVDLIRRAVKAIFANNRQAYGAKPEAGKRHSAFLSKRRRKYRGTYGIGQSRTPRKVLNRSGTRFHYVGAVAPQTVGGRRAHPPKASKIWTQKINKKENRKAIRSALSSTINLELVKGRGHIPPPSYPFVLTDDFTQISKTADLIKALETLGFNQELSRAQSFKVRAGKGKNRGRKYKAKTSILFVVNDYCDLVQAVNNIPGCDIISVKDLNAYILAPGAQPGRLTLFTQSAVKELEEKGYFNSDYKGEKQ